MKNIFSGTSFAAARLTVLGAGLNLFVGTGQLLLFTFGVFVKPIVSDTGWDRSIVGSATMCGQLILALCAPVVGLAIDRFGARRVALLAGPLLGFGMCLIGFLATSLTMFLVAFCVCFLLGALQVPVTYVKAIAAWYRESLGLALGTAMLFSGVGVAVLPPVSVWLISIVGWRAAYAYLGVLVSGVNLLSVILLLREPRHANESDRVNRLSSTALLRMSGQLLRSPAFAFLATTFFFVSVLVGAGTWALPIVLNDRGLSAQSSSSIMFVVGSSMTAARFFFGMLLDRVDPQRLSAVVFMLASVGIGMLAVNASVPCVVIAGVLVGVALGSEVDAMAFLSARVFGAKNLGVVYGALSFFFSLGLGCGPAMLSIAMKVSGTYTPGFAIASMAGAIAAACVILAPLHSAPRDCRQIPV